MRGAMRHLHRCALLLVAAAAIQGVVHAEARSRVVVDLTTVGGGEAVVPLLRGAFGDGFKADVIGLEEVLDTGDGPWRVLPPGRLGHCASAPTSAADIESSLAEVEATVGSLEYARALADLDDLRNRLCACTEPLPTYLPSRIAFLQGIARFYTGDEDAARSSFRQAAELTEKLDWDRNFSPDPQQIFLLGLGDAIQSARSHLRLSLDDRPATLYIDGREIDSATTDVELVGARHVLQFDRGDGTLVGMDHYIDSPGDIDLIGPKEIRSRLSNSPDTDATGVAFAFLVESAVAKGYTEVMVLNDERWDHCWWFNVIDDEWRHITLAAGAKLREAKRNKTAGGVLAGTGAAMMVGGALLAATHLTAMSDLKPEMEGSASGYALHIDEYNAHRSSAGVGIGLLAGGGVAASMGVVFLARGAALQREAAVDPRLTVVVSPGGAWFAISGTF